nr:glycosyltransferase family 2 protein [Lachnospiraceae bacterium]
MDRVGIVVCNYNKEKDVITCINSIIENKYTSYHVYVVDNASTDGSVAQIRKYFSKDKRITLIVNPENLGGSGGFNTGLRMAFKAGHEYLMCVDNDAILDEACIGSLLEFHEKHPNVGIVAPKIYHTDCPGYIQQFGSYIDFENYYVNSTYLNRIDDETIPGVVYSDAVPACALMIKRRVVEKIGFMPEENFIYWDDTEWCYRCKEAGYKIASIGYAAASHAMGAKGECSNTFPTYYSWRNWIVFFKNHLPEERLEDMAEVFLNSIFQLTYEDLYKGDDKKTKTVMAALDDALHGVMGKAGPDRIFTIEDRYTGLEKILKGASFAYVAVNGYPLYANYIIKRIGEIDPKIKTMKVEQPICTNNGDHIVISLCENIFEQDDLSLKMYICDLNGEIITDENDVMKVINFPYARHSFKNAL